MSASPPDSDPPLPCTVDINHDGSGFAMLYIPEDVMRRIRSRAGKQELGDYMWQAIFKAALYGHVY
jgi:hypothetical protein